MNRRLFFYVGGGCQDCAEVDPVEPGFSNLACPHHLVVERERDRREKSYCIFRLRARWLGSGTSAPSFKFMCFAKLLVHPQDLIRQVAVFGSMLLLNTASCRV